MKAVIALFTVMLIGVFGFSQTLENPGTPEERATKITLEMQAHMQLDSIQLQRVEALNLKYAKMAQKEIIDKDLSKWSMYRQGIRLNAKKEQELKPLLSARQWEAYEQLKKQRTSKLLGAFF
jgi:hypothetical protein